jgi:hypothetical protein
LTLALPPPLTIPSTSALHHHKSTFWNKKCSHLLLHWEVGPWRQAGNTNDIVLVKSRQQSSDATPTPLLISLLSSGNKSICRWAKRCLLHQWPSTPDQNNQELHGKQEKDPWGERKLHSCRKMVKKSCGITLKNCTSLIVGQRGNLVGFAASRNWSMSTWLAFLRWEWTLPLRFATTSFCSAQPMCTRNTGTEWNSFTCTIEGGWWESSRNIKVHINRGSFFWLLEHVKPCGSKTKKKTIPITLQKWWRLETEGQNNGYLQ